MSDILGCFIGAQCLRYNRLLGNQLPSSPLSFFAGRTKGKAMNFLITGKSVSAEVDLRTSLLDLLREHLGLTGSKKGCNQGACGACTVLVDGERILSCLALAVQDQDRSMTTIEG